MVESARFVLVGPQFGGNTGSAARALKNLGFSRLVLVRPHFGLEDPEARKMAVDARDVLAAAHVVDDLDAALAGAAGVVGMTARKGKLRKPHYRLDRFGAALGELAGAGELAIVFGCEESGLNDADLDRCTHLVELPASREYSSFNLAQAVLLAAWELRRASPWHARRAEAAPPAPHEDREQMFGHLEEALLEIGFLHDESVEPIMRRMRRLIGRAVPTPLEVRMLRGLARQTMWAAGQAGLSRGKHVGPAADDPDSGDDDG